MSLLSFLRTSSNGFIGLAGCVGISRDPEFWNIMNAIVVHAMADIVRHIIFITDQGYV
jgi:hypothetical protein